MSVCACRDVYSGEYVRRCAGYLSLNQRTHRRLISGQEASESRCGKLIGACEKFDRLSIAHLCE